MEHIRDRSVFRHGDLLDQRSLVDALRDSELAAMSFVAASWAAGVDGRVPRDRGDGATGSDARGMSGGALQSSIVAVLMLTPTALTAIALTAIAPEYQHVLVFVW